MKVLKIRKFESEGIKFLLFHFIKSYQIIDYSLNNWSVWKLNIQFKRVIKNQKIWD